jgi:predicted nucleic acid-binding protein
MITWLLDQASAATVESFLEAADAGSINLVMSWMNVGEVYYIISKRHGRDSAEEFLTRLPSLPIRLVLPDQDGILAAARVKAKHPVAFSDAFAIAPWLKPKTEASLQGTMKSGSAVLCLSIGGA